MQIVDLKSRQVVQTLIQPAAFFGIGFSRDGTELFVSGGNDDTIFCYSWRDGTAALERKIMLAEKSVKPGSRYPAGLAVSRIGNYLYVAENIGDGLAVVDLATSKVVQRFPIDHYPYAVEAAILQHEDHSVFPERRPRERFDNPAQREIVVCHEGAGCAIACTSAGRVIAGQMPGESEGNPTGMKSSSSAIPSASRKCVTNTFVEGQ